MTLKLTRARKQHECCLCHGNIEAGTDYVRQVNFPSSQDNGMFFNWTAHVACEAVLLLCEEVRFRLESDGLIMCPDSAEEWIEILQETIELLEERDREKLEKALAEEAARKNQAKLVRLQRVREKAGF